MKNKNSGIKWHRVFGIASIVSVLILVIMLYADYGSSIRSLLNIGSKESDAAVTDDVHDAADSDEESDNSKTNVSGKVSNKAIVCIDASHGGSDTGQYDGKNYEKTQVLELAKLVESNLTEQGIKVVMTRTTDESVDYTTRIRSSNSSKAVALVSLHRDVARKNGESKGVSTWIYTSSPSDSKKLAGCIIDGFSDSGVVTNGVNTGTPDDPAKDYYLNQHSTSASCIVELGNMYSNEDNRLVTTDKEKTAKMISDGIIKYLEQAGYING